MGSCCTLPDTQCILCPELLRLANATQGNYIPTPIPQKVNGHLGRLAPHQRSRKTLGGGGCISLLQHKSQPYPYLNGKGREAKTILIRIANSWHRLWNHSTKNRSINIHTIVKSMCTRGLILAIWSLITEALCLPFDLSPYPASRMNTICMNSESVKLL